LYTTNIMLPAKEITEALIINRILRQKLTGIYNKLCKNSNPNQKETDLKRTLEKLFLAHDSQESDLKKL